MYVCAVAAWTHALDCTMVDPMIGTEATGHAFPGPCRPFGLVQPSPDTGNGSWRYCSGYAGDDRSIRRFSQTHLNGTGQAGLGDVAFLPFVGELSADVAGFAVPFDKMAEHAELGLYRVVFRNGVKVEIAAGRRLAKYRIDFPSGTRSGLLLDFPYGLYREKGYLKHLTTACHVEKISNHRLRGLNHSEVWAPRDIGYVVAFDRDADELVELPRGPADKGPRFVAWFTLGGHVEVSVALSARSVEGAERNFAAEAGKSFETLVDETRAEWTDLLNRVDGSNLSEMERRTAATAVYHLFVQPNIVSDVGEPVRYSTFSLWDTFRDAHPLYEKLVPELVPELVRSLLAHDRAYGYLSQWELWGRETGGMIGSHAVPVIVDAFEHGFKGFDPEEAYQAVKRTLTVSARPGKGVTYPVRTDWEIRDTYGYYPFDLVKRESVSRTLECCYDDFRAAAFARALGKTEDAAFFERRSWGFTNLFDRTTFCFRGKDSKGRWREPFNPAGLSCDFTEGSALQWSWYVVHRPDWLVDAMGGRDAFVRRLDAFFAGTLFPGADRGHSQDVTGLIGDYAHGNEPCHHVVDLYRLVGRGETADALERRIFREFYRPEPGGLCGNDDCGQMSAWYLRRRLGK